MTEHVKNTNATEHEAVALALVQRLGVRAPVEIVDWAEAFKNPPSEPVVRIGQTGEARVAQVSYARTGNLDIAPVKIVAYGTDAPNVRNALINNGRVHVLDRFQHVARGVDLYEMEVGRTVTGRVGAFPARGVAVELAILPISPVIGPGEDPVMQMARAIAGDTAEGRQRGSSARGALLAHMANGEQTVGTELVSVETTDSEPDESGRVERLVLIEACVWPARTMYVPRVDLGFVSERSKAVLQALPGRGFVGAGRITEVDILEHAAPEDVRRIDVKFSLTLRGRIGGAQ